MSTSFASVQLISSVDPHPNADRLEVVEVCGYTVVVRKNDFKPGDPCVFFPPDNLIQETYAESLGVAAYLKHAVYPGDTQKSKCRIGAARIRGVSSYGFVIPTNRTDVDTNVNLEYAVVRYEPPVKTYSGAAIQEHPKFFRYYEIENVQRYPDLIPEGTPVIYTEKLHGSNCRLGVIDGEIVAGSHRVQIAFDSAESLYWRPYAVCEKLLNDMKEDGVDIIIFGEVYGPGVQDLQYNIDKPSFRCFDIMVGGSYLSALIVRAVCDAYGIPNVPLLGSGAFSREKLAELTDGKSTLADHIREGVVVKALEETHPRQILKSVSVDYLSRD